VSVFLNKPGQPVSKRSVKRRSNFHNFAIVLCALALFVAQTFGGHLRYMCDCGGKMVATQSSHCHGPHHADCHADETEADSPHNEKDSGDRKDHQVVKDEVQSRPVDTAPQLVAPQVLLAILPMVEALVVSQEIKVPASYPLEFGESPPLGVTVARTIVLLI
jgi:hypothetical protein